MNVIVGYDGSILSEYGVELARLNAKAINAKISLMRSMKQDPDLKKEVLLLTSGRRTKKKSYV